MLKDDWPDGYPRKHSPKPGEPRNITCLLCHHLSAHVLVVAPDFEYACLPGNFLLSQCDRCGHISLDPMPVVEDIPAFYPKTYYTVNSKSPLYLQGFIYQKKIQRDTKRILSFVKDKQLHSVVDIGCGDAARLFRLAEQRSRHDLNLVGVDLMFTDVILTKAQKLGIKLVEGNAETDLAALADGGHDLILMSQLIEHLIHPDAALQNIRPKLSAKGMILLETPCVGHGLDYWLFRNRYWGGYHIPRHLHIFQRDSLAELVERCGYRVLQRGFLPSPGFWIISLRNRLGLSSTAYSSSPLEFLNFSNLLSIGLFTSIDLIAAMTPLGTSNQFILAQKH
ncbi:MAG: class I SAM-dependent methyltransferase [Xenococcus sp. MO_188.B8]|nr:class I SAM-dependent methyltransferase [Xenococcus sp. MO_188.B8]